MLCRDARMAGPLYGLVCIGSVGRVGARSSRSFERTTNHRQNKRLKEYILLDTDMLIHIP